MLEINKLVFGGENILSQTENDDELFKGIIFGYICCS